MEIKKSEFIKSMKRATDYADFGLPEIAVAGRSNAGKSSLINCVTRNSKLAKVSGAPGKTRLINFFRLNDAVMLVDLPGYGYAKVSKEEKSSWDAMTRAYFDTSKNLRAILALMDIRRTPSEFDRQMLKYAQTLCVPFIIIATKADKLAKTRRPAALKAILGALGIQSGVDILAFSALSGAGREELVDLIFQYAALPENGV